MSSDKVNITAYADMTPKTKDLVDWVYDAPKGHGLSLKEMMALAKRVGMDISPWTNCVLCREHIMWAYIQTHTSVNTP